MRVLFVEASGLVFTLILVLLSKECGGACEPVTS